MTATEQSSIQLPGSWTDGQRAAIDRMEQIAKVVDRLVRRGRYALRATWCDGFSAVVWQDGGPDVPMPMRNGRGDVAAKLVDWVVRAADADLHSADVPQGLDLPLVEVPPRLSNDCTMQIAPHKCIKGLNGEAPSGWAIEFGAFTVSELQTRLASSLGVTRLHSTLAGEFALGTIPKGGTLVLVKADAAYRHPATPDQLTAPLHT